MLTVTERDVMVLSRADARDRLRSLRVTGFSFVARIGTEDVAAPITTGVVVPSRALVDVAALSTSPSALRVMAATVGGCRKLGVQVIADVATPEQARYAREAGCAFAVGRGVGVGPRA